MHLFKITDKELLIIRNDIFIEEGIPALEKNGFCKSPFTGAWFGRNNLKDFTYEFCRLSGTSFLEMITTHISKGDKYIKIFLNIFKLEPDLSALKELKGNGIKFSLPPNSFTKMRLRDDDYKGPPIFYMLLYLEYKIKRFYSKKGLDRQISKLRELVNVDMNNIDNFIERWYQMHSPKITDWEGNSI